MVQRALVLVDLAREDGYDLFALVTPLDLPKNCNLLWLCYLLRLCCSTADPGLQDIQAAQGGKAQALGVLTGVYSRQDLEGCGAGVLACCLQLTAVMS